MTTPWTERQLATLRHWYPKEGANPMRYEGRTAAAIRAKANSLGIACSKPGDSGPYWTEREDDILRRRYSAEGSSLKRMLPGRTEKAIVDRAGRLGLTSMRHKGIATLADLARRCKFDFGRGARIEKCWRWSCACSHDRIPVAWLPSAGRTVSVLRISALLAGMIESDRDPRTVWRQCRSADCVNPSHLAVGTRAEYGAWAASVGVNAPKPGAALRLRAARVRSGATKLTTELAQWAIESGQPGVDVAHALDCSATTVCRVRLGRTWGVIGGSVAASPMQQMAASLARLAPANDTVTEVAA